MSPRAPDPRSPRPPAGGRPGERPPASPRPGAGERATTPPPLPPLCRRLRRKILRTALTAGGGHIAPAFSAVEIVATLYCGGILRVDPERPDWPERDRFVLSKGHGCLAQYVALAERGFFPAEYLDRFTRPGGLLGGHPDRKIPGVEASTGSLGHGLPIGLGMALAARLDRRPSRAFVVLSDGECQEGSVWEAVMLASHLGLDNLVAVVDFNGLQSLGPVTDVMRPMQALGEQWRAFGWEVRELDGHDTEALLDAFTATPFVPGRPSVVIAHTVKGKGVSFMEGVPLWHYRLPAGDEIARAWSDLGGEDGP